MDSDSNRPGTSTRQNKTIRTRRTPNIPVYDSRTLAIYYNNVGAETNLGHFTQTGKITYNLAARKNLTRCKHHDRSPILYKCGLCSESFSRCGRGLRERCDPYLEKHS